MNKCIAWIPSPEHLQLLKANHKYMSVNELSVMLGKPWRTVEGAMKRLGLSQTRVIKDKKPRVLVKKVVEPVAQRQSDPDSRISDALNRLGI